MYIEKVSRDEFVEICQENYDEDFTARDLFHAVIEYRKQRAIHRYHYRDYTYKLPPFIACVAMPALQYDRDEDSVTYQDEDVFFFVVMDGGRLYGFEIERDDFGEAADFYEEEWEEADDYEEEEEDAAEEYEDELAVC